MEQTLAIPAETAVSIASLATHTANPKDGAPVLSEINVSITGTQLAAYATDRFSLAEYKAIIPGQAATQGDQVHNFRLSATAAKFISTNVKKLNKWRAVDPVEFTIQPETRELLIKYGDATLRDAWIADKYPRVEQLLDNWEPATDNKQVKLRSSFLARLGKLVDAFAKVDYWVLQTGYAGEFGESKGRPGPVLATAGNYRVLIQPNVYNPEDKI